MTYSVMVSTQDFDSWGLGSNPSRSTMKTIFTFIKEPDNRWFVDLPDWEGDKEQLEMVCGADIMLDILAQGQTLIQVKIDQANFPDSKFVLKYLRDGQEEGGAYYNCEMYSQSSFEIWLCDVTKFVFGHFPKKLYCK
jgi:hypothetical protein